MMTALKPIRITGGGLAGLTLGIGLRRRGVPVTLSESGHYPRHRVCGEFISGRGQATLARLGLLERLEELGAVKADTAAFFSTNRTTGPRRLPAPALCLSRFTLDAALANTFRELGGELIEGQRLRDEDAGEGIVRATGRQVQVEEKGSRWFGLKAHARNVSLAADLEMHVSPRGYVGLCRVNGGLVNVCGLFRHRAGENDHSLDRLELLRGRAGSLLSQRLVAAEFDENSFCAVAGLSLRPHQAVARAECCVGDAITMIPPITGNGMSMAFESAELAVEPLAKWSHGENSWIETRSQIARRCDAAFARRLAWAQWLQRFLLTPSMQNVLVALASHSDRFWRLAFEKTR
jgi:2-polyprenyl-6-methoxyphenol hydroxylase-like FAD-dependent oxidoreductase